MHVSASSIELTSKTKTIELESKNTEYTVSDLHIGIGSGGRSSAVARRHVYPPADFDFPAQHREMPLTLHDVAFPASDMFSKTLTMLPVNGSICATGRATVLFSVLD